MSVRTVKGTVFTILVDGKRIVVKHVHGKGKRCRVTVPPGVTIVEQGHQSAPDDDDIANR